MAGNFFPAVFASLPEVEGDDLWSRNRRALRAELSASDRVLECATVQATMYIGNGAPWTAEELEYLQERYGRDDLEYLLNDNGFGGGTKIGIGKHQTNGTFIQQLLHLTIWQEMTGRNVSDLDAIVEVGGGFGAARLMASRMGFDGIYAIYDFPEVFELARFYLANIEALGVVAAPNNYVTEYDLLIATHSIDEMKSVDRWSVLSYFPTQSYLFNYADQWEGVDNTAFFEQLKVTADDEFEWQERDAVGFKNHRYLVGVRHEFRDAD